MPCAVCRKPVTADAVHAKDGSDAVCCVECYAATIARLERIRAERGAGCDAGCVGGCDCPENLRAIARGEAAKCREEEREGA